MASTVSRAAPDHTPPPGMTSYLSPPHTGPTAANCRRLLRATPPTRPPASTPPHRGHRRAPMDRTTPQHWLIGLIPTIHHTWWGPERCSTPKTSTRPHHGPRHATTAASRHPGPALMRLQAAHHPASAPQGPFWRLGAICAANTCPRHRKPQHRSHTSAASPPPLERGLLSSSEVAQTKSTPVFVNTNHANERAGEPAGPRAAVTWYGCSPALPSPSCTCQRQSLYRPLRARTRE